MFWETSNCYSNPSGVKGKCAICDQDVKNGEDVSVDRKILHKTCFSCGCCGAELKIGQCSRDNSLETDFGLRWFCRDHKLTPPGQKAELMTKRGIEKKKKNLKK